MLSKTKFFQFQDFRFSIREELYFLGSDDLGDSFLFSLVSRVCVSKELLSLDNPVPFHIPFSTLKGNLDGSEILIALA